MGYKKKQVLPGLICSSDLDRIREAVCIQVEKIYDSCKEKNCVEDAQVYFRNPYAVQGLIRHAINVKVKNANVVKVVTDVEEVPFKRGFYTVDVKFFIKLDVEFYVTRPNGGIGVTTVPGLITFDKKVILFGSEGNVKIFKSQFSDNCVDIPVHSALEQSNLPIAKIEVADPIALSARVVDRKSCKKNTRDESFIPSNVSEMLEDVEIDDFGIESEGEDRGGPNSAGVGGQDRRVVATVGLFSIIKLVRNIQLLIPAFDFCVPHKQCIASTEDEPCELFETIEFPIEEFYPPQIFDFPGAAEQERSLAQEEPEEES
jgi:hypothetical protein